MIFWLHTAIVVGLLVAFPLWDRRETRRLKTGTTTRVRSYQKTIAWMWTVSLILLATSRWTDLNSPPAVPGLANPSVVQASWPIALALTAGILLPVLLAWRFPTMATAQTAQLAPLAFFLPQSAPDRRWFAVVCLSAGICEEIIFRGFLLDYLSAAPFAFPPWGAVFGAAFIFAIDHGYQGWTGMLSTGVMAIVLTALFVMTGALWIPMVIHALIDLRVLALLSLSARRTAGASAGSAAG